jgi:hypothetical protein
MVFFELILDKVNKALKICLYNPYGLVLGAFSFFLGFRRSNYGSVCAWIMDTIHSSSFSSAIV